MTFEVNLVIWHKWDGQPVLVTKSGQYRSSHVRDIRLWSVDRKKEERNRTDTKHSRRLRLCKERKGKRVRYKTLPGYAGRVRKGKPVRYKSLRLCRQTKKGNGLDFVLSILSTTYRILPQQWELRKSSCRFANHNGPILSPKEKLRCWK